MKQTITLLTALLLTSFAQAEPQKGKKAPPHLLEKFDVDGDGTLSKEERKEAKKARRAEHKKFRDSFDTDGDGTLSPTEKEAYKAAREQKLVTRFDADGDGTLNEEEQAKADRAKKRAKKHFKKASKEKDSAAN